MGERRRIDMNPHNIAFSILTTLAGISTLAGLWLSLLSLDGMNIPWWKAALLVVISLLLTLVFSGGATENTKKGAKR